MFLQRPKRRSRRCALCSHKQRCVRAVLLPRKPCGGDHFKHAQRQFHGLACAPRVRCEDALLILYLEAAFATHFGKTTSYHELFYGIFNGMNELNSYLI